MNTFVEMETAAGRIRGYREHGIHVFKGIPYGADTGGAARFRRPSPPRPWRGVRDALRYGAPCPQHSVGIIDPVLLDLLRGGFEAAAVASEDCLVLNIWTPQLRDGGRRPVMVWCHGGRFSEGSGGNEWCDGRSLAARGDVVVVTLNHRLNLFGYLHLADLTGPCDGAMAGAQAAGVDRDSAFVESGNAGMLDIVAALEWVREHIGDFGGDPHNVTLFGNSGGGAKINTLLAMPAARGLFHKAIVQSAPVVGASATRQYQSRIAAALFDQLGLSPRHPRTLQNMSVERLLQAAATVESAMAGKLDLGPFTPVVDGIHLHEHPFRDHAPALGADIPLLIGTNAQEMTLLLGPDAFDIDRAGLLTFVQHLLAVDRAQAGRVVAAYRDTRPIAGDGDLLFAIATDHALRAGAVRQADMKSTQRAAVYMYLFNWGLPACGGRYGAMHGAEVPFVFGNVAAARGFEAQPAQYRALEERISTAWTTFARHGDPNHPGLPHWPRYDAHTRQTMRLGNAVNTVIGGAADDDRCRCDVMTSPPLLVESIHHT